MNSYFEQMILSASPVELVRLLYQRAISSVREAREHLRHRRIAERCASVNVAYAVLLELAGSLKDDEAPEFTARLKDLYGYMQARLVEANMQQADEPLAEVLGLLVTLAEAWTSIADPVAVPAARGSRDRDMPEAEMGPEDSARYAEPLRYALSA